MLSWLPSPNLCFSPHPLFSKIFLAFLDETEILLCSCGSLVVVNIALLVIMTIFQGHGSLVRPNLIVSHKILVLCKDSFFHLSCFG